MAGPDLIDQRLNTVGQQRFRAKFHLREDEAAIIGERGMDVVRDHARDLIIRR